MTERLVQYFRSGIRGLLRTRGFTLVAVLTIALGIGAAATIFSLVDAAFLHSLPYPDAGRLVAISSTRKGDEISDSYPDVLDWRTQNHSFTDIAAFANASVSLSGGDADAERIRGQLVTPNLFRVLRVPVARGRDFTDAEFAWGTPRVVILSDGLWKRRFGADPAIVGRTVSINREPYAVVGVMPAGFDFPGGIVYGAADLWMPSGTGEKADWMDRGSHPGLYAMGRLRDGVTLAAARHDMDAVAANLRAAYAADDKDQGIQLRGALASIVGDLVPGFSLVGVAALLLLLITSANVAGLLLARGVARHREIAIRTALGATRRDIVAQLLTESVLLGVLGGALGVACAWAGVHAARPLLSGIPRAASAHVDWRVIAFALALSIVTSALFGIGPALAATGHGIGSWLGGRGGAGGIGRARIRRMLVAGEIAAALVLVVCATMLARSFGNMLREKGGIEAEGVLTFEVRPPDAAYPAGPRVLAFFTELTDRLAALNGVKSTGGISVLPFSGAGAQSGMQTLASGDEPIRTDVAVVTPEYFRAIGMQLVAGRGLTAADDSASAPVAVIDSRFARRFWQSESDAVGKQISGWGFRALTVVGVVRHVANYGVAAESRQELFVPFAQRPSSRMVMVVRTSGDPAALSQSIRRVVAAMDPQLPVYNLRTMRDVVAGTTNAPRLATSISGVLAMLALVLAAVGLYGVLAFTVGQRTREIGVRMALGATAPGVVRMVLREAAALTVCGIGLGLVMAFGAATLLKGQLFGVAPIDPITFALAPIVFAIVSIIASSTPALRAARVSPIEALRDE